MDDATWKKYDEWGAWVETRPWPPKRNDELDLVALIAEHRRLRNAVQAWCDADRACEELIEPDSEHAAEVFNARIAALHAAQDGLHAAMGEAPL